MGALTPLGRLPFFIEGGNVHDMMSLRLWVPLVLAVWVSVPPVQAAAPGAAPAAEMGLTEAAPAQAVELAPMSDPAAQGAACLGFAALSMTAAYAAGPMEALMLMSGAQHVATGPLTLFIPMFSILGGGACALAAAAMPSVSWVIDQSGNMGDQLVSLTNGWLGGRSGDGPATTGEVDDGPSEEATKPPTPIRPMTETEVQSAGCVVGAVAGLGASMASSPMEVAMLASGATTVVSSTPLLGLGLLATIVGAACGIGSLVSIPVMAFMDNYSAIGNNLFDAVGQEIAWATGNAIPGDTLAGAGRAGIVEGDSVARR